MADLDGGKLNIHRLVQQVIRIKLGEGNEEEKVVEKALGLFRSSINSNSVDHAVSAWDHAKKYNELVKEFSKLPSQIIGKLDDSVRYEEAYLFGMEALKSLKAILGSDHHDALAIEYSIALTLKNQGKYNEALKVLQEVYEKRREKLGESHPDTRKTKDNIDRLSQLLGSSGGHEMQMAECLPNSRRKRETENGCLFTWEDVDEFNEEKDEIRDLDKIKIDSEKFVNYIKDLPERKRSQLIQLAGEVRVTGKSQGLIHKLTNNRRVMSHLARVGKISGMTMHGMMAKNVLADFLNGNYQGVAINVGFIAGGQGFAKVAEAASIKGLKLASEGKLLLGRSLKAASPFLARGTSAFVVYDLVNQVKAL